jgi:predicted ATPase
LGLTCLVQGDSAEARANLEEVLRIHDPERDREVKFRFASDNAVSATVYLGLLEWLLGNLGQGKELVERAVKLAVESNHPPTLANAHAYRSTFEIFRGNAANAQRDAEAVIKTSREYGTALYSAAGAIPNAWASARLGDRETGIADFRQALADWSGQGNKLLLPFYEGLLAELEAEGEGADGALIRIDGALALVGETGEHWTDAFLHRIRGEILLKRDPANTAPAEEAFLTAISIAQGQKARSFELRAALSLAKLYQSTGRAADAHAVLVPALQGFSPRPEFPEIAEAQTLLAALA